MQNRARNKVLKIQNMQGNWLEFEEDISRAFTSYFQNLFGKGVVRGQNEVLQCVKPVISDEINMFLISDVCKEEIKCVSIWSH